MRNLFVTKLIHTWNLNFPNTSVGFRQNHKTQHAVLRIIELWRALLNKGQKVGVIIMDLSETFDTLNQKLLLKKLQACGFDKGT